MGLDFKPEALNPRPYTLNLEVKVQGSKLQG